MWYVSPQFLAEIETYISFMPKNEAVILYCYELKDEALIGWTFLFRHHQHVYYEY